MIRSKLLTPSVSECPSPLELKFLSRERFGVRVTRVELQKIPQLIIVYEILLQPTSRRFLRELDEAPGGNTLHYILQCLCIPALVTRVWTRKVHWVAMECSWNDGSETQYYYVILDRLQGRSGGLERVPELRIRGPLTFTPPPRLLHLEAIVLVTTCHSCAMDQ